MQAYHSLASILKWVDSHGPKTRQARRSSTLVRVQFAASQTTELEVTVDFDWRKKKKEAPYNSQFHLTLVFWLTFPGNGDVQQQRGKPYMACDGLEIAHTDHSGVVQRLARQAGFPLGYVDGEYSITNFNTLYRLVDYWEVAPEDL